MGSIVPPVFTGLRETPEWVSELRHAFWWVRHYRGARNRLRRQQAILRLGLALREAFNKTEDFEPLLTAILEGLRPDNFDHF